MPHTGTGSAHTCRSETSDHAYPWGRTCTVSRCVREEQRAYLVHGQGGSQQRRDGGEHINSHDDWMMWHEWGEKDAPMAQSRAGVRRRLDGHDALVSLLGRGAA